MVHQAGVEHLRLKHSLRKHFHLLVRALGTQPALFACCLYKREVAVTASFAAVKKVCGKSDMRGCCSKEMQLLFFLD